MTSTTTPTRPASPAPSHRRAGLRRCIERRREARGAAWLPVALFIVIALTALGTSACAEDGATVPASVALGWAAGPTASCADVGVELVEVRMHKGDREWLRRTFPCADGSTVIEAVEPGRYDVEILGLSADGLITFAAERPGVRLDEGELLDLGMVRMEARPAHVEIQWFFGNGRLCAQNDVSEVGVTLYDDELYVVQDVRFGCDAGAGVLEPLPAGAYTIEIVGWDAAGREQASGVAVVELERGEDLLLEIALDD